MRRGDTYKRMGTYWTTQTEWQPQKKKLMFLRRMNSWEGYRDWNTNASRRNDTKDDSNNRHCGGGERR